MGKLAPWALAFCAASLAGGCGSGSDQSADLAVKGRGELPSEASPKAGLLRLSVLSSRPEAVSGGDALIRIEAPPGIDLSRVSLKLDDTDVSASLSPDGKGGLMGLIGGMSNGKHTLYAFRDGMQFDRLELTSHPITGPIFSGPQQQPFLCQTAQFRIYPGGPFLGDPLDAQCSAATRVDYLYRDAGGTFQPFDPAGPEPAGMTRTTTKEGQTVRYIVRLETGTTNRAIYQLSVLHDPVADAEPNFASRPAGWNDRLVYTFGGGCTNGWYRQGATTGGVLDDNILSKGYAMASASLNVFGNNCGDLTSAETMSMVKERFIEAYGAPRYTIGWGCSGGSYQQHQIADNYPGLLDGILPGCSFPEVGFATVHMITDARLLVNYFDTIAPGAFDQEQQRQVAGVLNYATMRTNTVFTGALRISPNYAPYCTAVPGVERYDPVSNPTGVRCGVYEHMVNVLGTDPATGFARRPLDNVGIQYGLAALNSGVISVDQFLDLNEKIGGYDIDANFQSARTVADPLATRAAYRTGRLTNGGGGLKDVPIIDYRAYSDDNPIGDIHLRYHSFSMRERLKNANGHADNQVMLVEDFRYGYYSSASPLLMHALETMDLWLANIEADGSSAPKSVKVVRNKPASLQEGCLTRDPNPVMIVENQVRGSGQCEVLYPSSPPPREVAGGPVEADVIKCQLKPVDYADYSVTFTPAQSTRLQAIFPDGVCDWSKPGLEQQGLAGTWLSYPF